MDLLCRILRGEDAAWPGPPGASPFTHRFLDAATYHGIGPLLCRKASSGLAGRDWPSELSEAWAGETHREAAVELVRQRELVATLESLAAQGIQPLLMKGAALAYTHYESPALRPRCDTDVFVRERDVDAIEKVLTTLGYGRPNAVSGSLVCYQCAYVRRDRHGVQHALDVHWRINNGQLFARALSYEEAACQAVPVPPLGQHARGLAPVHALFLACVHRAAHEHAPYYIGDTAHYGGDRLIWLYDIHLLLSRLSREELDAFVELAASRQVRTVCLAALRRTQECFGTVLPDDVVQALSTGGTPEMSAVYVEGGRLQAAWSEFRSLPSVGSRLLLLREHLFPPADYMLKKYGLSSRVWLPALYAHRGLRGAWKLLHGR